MKSNKFKISFNKSSNKEKQLEELQKKTNFSSKAVKSTMTEQLIVPPARVWDKIEKILDEQDERRNTADKLITSSFAGKSESKPKKLYLATIAGLGVAAGVAWLVL